MPLKQVEPPQIEMRQFWHRRLKDDPANRRLRSVFHEVNRRDADGQMSA